MPVLFLENCTWDQIQKLNKDRTVVILPTGSIEQHGLHLPLNTDSYIINEISKKCLPTSRCIPLHLNLGSSIIFIFNNIIPLLLF